MNIERMTDEMKIAAIRKACGWGDASRNPLNDLNAMHEAEKTLDDASWLRFKEYLERLAFEEIKDTGAKIFRPHSASAKLRANAFLLTQPQP